MCNLHASYWATAEEDSTNILHSVPLLVCTLHYNTHAVNRHTASSVTLIYLTMCSTILLPFEKLSVHTCLPAGNGVVVGNMFIHTDLLCWLQWKEIGCYLVWKKKNYYYLGQRPRKPLTTAVSRLSVYLPQDHTLCQYCDASIDRRASGHCLNHWLSNLNNSHCFVFGMPVSQVVLRTDAATCTGL